MAAIESAKVAEVAEVAEARRVATSRVAQLEAELEAQLEETKKLKEGGMLQQASWVPDDDADGSRARQLRSAAEDSARIAELQARAAGLERELERLHDRAAQGSLLAESLAQVQGELESTRRQLQDLQQQSGHQGDAWMQVLLTP